jgi:hypothetical protein
MGVEWELACLGCNEYAWLGSLKPFKWHGFQVGNRVVAELLALHTTPTCRLIVDVDGARSVWGHPDDPVAGWRADLRSRHFWESSDEGECAVCRIRIGDADAQVVGLHLWFCSDRCRDTYAARPGCVWRAAPTVRTEIRVTCTRCDTEFVLARPTARGEHSKGGFEPLADWFASHIGCPLEARIEIPT